MLDQIQLAAQRYASRAITRGEALEDIIASLEAGGRDVLGPRRGRRPAEARTWAPASGPPGEDVEASARKAGRRRPAPAREARV